MNEKLDSCLENVNFCTVFISYETGKVDVRYNIGYDPGLMPFFTECQTSYYPFI